jgi:hypothetical protein
MIDGMASNDPQDEMDVLLNFLLPYARDQLEQNGDFVPTGATLSDAGTVSAVNAGIDDPRAASDVVVAALTEAIRREAEAGPVRGCGVVDSARVPRPGMPEMTDAIRVRIDHVAADPVHVFMPFRKRRMRGYEFDELFVEPGTSLLR